MRATSLAYATRNLVRLDKCKKQFFSRRSDQEVVRDIHARNIIKCIRAQMISSYRMNFVILMDEWSIRNLAFSYAILHMLRIDWKQRKGKVSLGSPEPMFVCFASTVHSFMPINLTRFVLLSLPPVVVLFIMHFCSNTRNPTSQ